MDKRSDGLDLDNWTTQLRKGLLELCIVNLLARGELYGYDLVKRLAEIKGPAFVLYWSWNFNGGWGELLSPVTWWRLLTREMRWDRIGDGVP